MNKSNLITLGVIASLLFCGALVTYYFYTAPNDASNSDAQRTLKLIESQGLTDLQGNPFSFEQFEGKVRIVNSFASWTPFSIDELSLLEELASTQSGEDGVVIAINRMESKEQTERFLNHIGSFEHIVFALDPTDSFYAGIEGYSMPETVFYDAQGNMTFHKRGSMNKDEMERLLKDARASAGQ